IGGGWLVAFIIVAVNACMLEAWRALRSRSPRGVGAFLGVALALLVAPLAIPRNDATGRPVKIAIVQGNVPRNWTGTYYEKQLSILSSHEHLTAELAPSDPDFVVWPESSVGIDAEDDPNAAGAIKRAAQAVDAPLIVGGNLDVGTERYKVMAFHVSPDGTIVDRYQKTHLVPFGEYVPARGLLGWIPALDQVPRDAIAADEPRTFEIGGGEVAPVISFEGDFGSLVRRPISQGGRLLVVATNTSTWGESAASAQHVAFSRVRAAETGVWVAHSAVSGISAFVAPDGSVAARTDLWTASALVETVAFAEDTTLYVRIGDWVPLAALAISVWLVAMGGRRRRAAGPSPPVAVARQELVGPPAE
ncbi:MAG: apolipoprotein N-acyltransferase, partial [Actinomycetota bacterium]